MGTGALLHGLLSGNSSTAGQDVTANPYLAGMGGLLGGAIYQPQSMRGAQGSNYAEQIATLERQRLALMYPALAARWPQLFASTMQPPAPPVPYSSGAPKHRPPE